MYFDGKKTHIEEEDLCISCQFQEDCTFMQALYFDVARLMGFFNLDTCRFYELNIPTERHLRVVKD
jgi:hypothetical protein